MALLPVLGVWACVSDFSPEPFKGPQNIAKTPDGGTLAVDAGRATTDASGGRDLTPDVATAVAPDTGSSQPPITRSPCDLSGRWIVTERAQSSAYGAQQVSLVWLYVALSQNGDALTVERSLLCGGSTNQAPGELFEVHMDDTAAWPAYQQYTNYNARQGRSTANGAGCDVSFEPASLIRGMTPGFYRDTTQRLPTVDQREIGTTPGWADWDNDGNPGISMVVTGAASGTIYTALRVATTSLSGSVAQSAQGFSLDDYDWKQERVVFGTREPDPIGLLSSPAERNPGAGLNFVEFARLGDDRATGSDDDICKAIRTLVPTLNPAANPQ